MKGEGHLGPDGFSYDRFARTSKIRRGGVQRAKRFRAEPTPAEAKLWTYLRKLPVRFRREVPIGRYVVDFACHRARLIIEVDGGIHKLPDVAARDAERQAALEREGYKVLRFTNNQVFDDPDAVIAAIRRSHPRLAEVEG